jgi:hypothetical protein
VDVASEDLPAGRAVVHLEGVQVLRSGPRPPARSPGRRCAFVEGFSLHADTWLHENDVVGLERLCNYGARGPLSLERLSALPDGRLAYRMKRPSPTGRRTSPSLRWPSSAASSRSSRHRGQTSSATSASSLPAPGCAPASCQRLLPYAARGSFLPGGA